MNAMPQPVANHTAPMIEAAPQAAGLADAIAAGPAKAPPHLLWETLESAFAGPGETIADPPEARLALHLALPIAVGVSLALWVVIVELVLTR